jgi:hypothetical protein
MPTFKARGHRGDWFAEANGQRLPCVHAHWWKGSGYNDPYARPGDRKFEELVEGIRQFGRVILTKDEVRDSGRTFRRTGYVAIYEVEDVEFDETGLRFRFISRVADLA